MGFNEDLVSALRQRQAMNLTPDGLPLLGTWNAEDYPVVVGDARMAKQLGIGGFGLDANLIMIIVMDDLVPGFQNADDLVGKIPKAQHKVLFQGYQYKISDTTTPPGLAFLVLALIEPTKGV